VFEEKELHKILEPKRSEEDGENYIMRSFIICVLHKILLAWSYQGGLNGPELITHGGR
jgi:hypothetical protein